MPITDYNSKFADVSRIFIEKAADALQQSSPEIDQALAAFVDEFPCTAASYKVGSLLDLGSMSRWIGPKEVGRFRAVADNVTLLPHHKTKGIPIEEILGDQTGLVARSLQNFLNDAAYAKLELATNKLVAGFTDLGYDGVPLISAGHVNGPSNGVQSNKVGSNSPLSHSAYATARQQMREIRDEEGRPMGITPTILKVGPSLESLAREIVAADRVQSVDNAGGLDTTSNVVGGANRSNGLAGTAQVVVNPLLIGDYASYWFLIDNTKSTLPVSFGVNPAMNMNPKDNLSTGEFLKTPEGLFSVELLAGVGYTFWQLIAGSTGAGS